MDRQALTVAVRTFNDTRDELDFAPALSAELAKALQRLGYHVCPAEPVDAHAAQLGVLVREILAQDGGHGVCLVHVLSHGHLDDQSLYVVGGDGKHDESTEVEGWLKLVERFTDDHATTLFLLDLCGAGQAALWPWQTAGDTSKLRAWVIAACAAKEAAFDGQFTRAVITVLTKLADNQLGIDPAIAQVPLAKIAFEVRREVLASSDRDDTIPQLVTCTRIDLADTYGPHPADVFFPNPHHREQLAATIRQQIDPGLDGFLDQLKLDDLLDAQHFYTRAKGTRS